MSEHELNNLFSEFSSDKVTIPPVTSLTINDWIKERKETYLLYKSIFSPSQISKLSESDFHYFLTSSGNKSWTNLPRGCKRVTTDMDKLKESILHIQDESIAIEKRLNDTAKGGSKYIKGFGKNLLTGLLHVMDWEKYGVWNNRSKKVLAGLGRLPRLSNNFAQSYLLFNQELKKMASEINTDLVSLDGFLWWLDHTKKIQTSRLSHKKIEKKYARIKLEAENWYQNVKDFVEAKKYENAIFECTKIIETEPHCTDAYLCRGTIYILIGLNRHARSDFIIAIEINPKDADAHWGLGGAYAAVEDNEMAINEFRIAARLGLKDAQDHLASNGIDW